MLQEQRRMQRELAKDGDDFDDYDDEDGAKLSTPENNLYRSLK